MSKFKQRDFYFGAALSLFFRKNNDAKPSLLENIDDKSQLIKMTTDTSKDFYIYMKYTVDKRYTKKDGLTSWNFNLSDKDKKKIDEIQKTEKDFFVFLICGVNDDYKTGEIAVLNKIDYTKLCNKNSITVKTIGNRAKKFTLHIGKAGSETFQIARNRIDNKLTS